MLNVNQPLTTLQDSNYLVVGLGVTGYSVACYLLKLGYRCKVQDTRDVPPFLGKLKSQFDSLDFRAQPLDAELIAWADVLVVSPGLSIRNAAIEQAVNLGKLVVGDIELFARIVSKPVITITGSNGKSTVTTLVGELKKKKKKSAAVGGNLGPAALDLLEQNPDFFVLELSSYQLETTASLQPRVAALLNICEDHLDRYPGYTEYIQAKLRIYDNATQCVSNYDDEVTRHDASDIGFSLKPDTNAEFRLLEDNGTWLAHWHEPWLSVDEIKVSGRHNWANCLAAMAIAHSVGISRAAIVSAIKQFAGIPHRGQWIAEIDGVEWINDSKATNVGAAQASIDGRERPVILIAGGQSKGADMSVMFATIKQKVKWVLLLGEDAPRLQEAWQGATRIQMVHDMKQAVRSAHKEACSGDCVLLAPACASFDMYPKFEARGDDFIRCVKELTDG